MSLFYASSLYYWDHSSRFNVLLVSQDKKYCFYLNEVASFLWPFLVKGISLEKMIDKVCHQFEVSSSVAKKDIMAWLEMGLREGFILKGKNLARKTGLFSKFFQSIIKSIRQ